MEELFINHNKQDYSVKYIINNRPYIWGFIRDNQYEEGNIRCFLIANLTDNPYVTFSKTLLIIDNKSNDYQDELINKILAKKEIKNIISLIDNSPYINLITKEGEIKLDCKRFRSIRNRREAHETLVSLSI
jgi:hypothetical protein